jgi:hypothetical protein
MLGAQLRLDTNGFLGVERRLHGRRGRRHPLSLVGNR